MRTSLHRPGTRSLPSSGQSKTCRYKRVPSEPTFFVHRPHINLGNGLAVVLTEAGRLAEELTAARRLLGPAELPEEPDADGDEPPEELCPHCGKELPNPEKLAWHLTRECPAMADIAAADEFALHVKLRHGRPVAECLHTFADVVVLQHIDAFERRFHAVEDFNRGRRKIQRTRDVCGERGSPGAVCGHGAL